MEKEPRLHNPTIDVREWRRQLRPALNQAERQKRRQRRAWVALIFGLGCAVAWHFIHLSSENYIFSLSDLHFWFHLTLEALLAVYAAAFGFIIWGLIAGEL